MFFFSYIGSVSISPTAPLMGTKFWVAWAFLEVLSVYQCVFVCVFVSVYTYEWEVVSWAGVWGTKEQGWSVTQLLPCCVCLSTFVKAFKCVCARMHAWETEKECNKAVHLGDLSGEATHCKTHLTYKWIHTLWVKNFKQTHTRAHTRSHTHIQHWIMLIFVNSRRHSVMQICFWLSLSLRWRRCRWQAESLPKLSFYLLNSSFHELPLLLKSIHTPLSSLLYLGN